MNMQALQSLLAQQAAAPPKAALEFKAGLMTMTGTTVTADPRRGKVSILPGDDGLVHFQWTQRPGGNLEPINDLVLFPGDSWERVPECKTGRVYLLRAGGSKRFFWLQEEKDDKDKEIETNINKFINDPSSISSSGGGDGPALNANDAEQEQLMQLLSSHGLLRNAPAGGPASAARPRPAAAPSTPAAAASTTPAAPNAPARPAASSAAPAGSAAPAAAPAAGANTQQIDALRALTQLMQSVGQRQQQPPLSLGAVADADRVIPLLNDDAKAVEALYPHLPEGQRNPQALRDTLRSPQLQQTLSRMTHALNSPQFGTVMASLGLPVGGADFGVNAFVRAVQERADQERKQQQGAAASSSSQASSSSPAAASSSAPSAPGSSPSASSGSSSSSSTGSQSKPDPKDAAKK